MRIPKERAAVLPQEVSLGKLLLVEGETPSHFFEALARALGLDEAIEIRSFRGISELGEYLRTIASTSAFKEKVTSLGIARDAENDPQAARQSVDHAVRAAGLPGNVTVHVAILPDESTAGMIETLCLRSVGSDCVMECVDAFFACIEGKGVALSEGFHRDKPRAWVYLAGKNYPETAVGIAAEKGVWPFEHPAFDTLKRFLKGL